MWTTSGLLLQLMASYAAIQVVESQTALTLPSSPPPPPPPPELNFILFLPFSVPDYGWNYTQGHLYAEVASFNAAAEAAVDDGTSIPPSLQGVRINMIKVNMWDPEFTSPDLFPIVDSGGYASAALYDAIIGKPVAGIIGDVYSRTTIFTAGVASQLKVPFCGATQASPRLADRRNYGYFFRMEVGEGYGSFTANLLHRFEVNRVILVAGTDTFSASVSKDVEKGLREGGILIAASVRITSDVIVSKKFDHILSTIARHNIRYIFVSLLPEDISGFYYAAAKYGLTGPNYVWMGLNAPIVTPNDPDMEWKLAVGEGFLISTPMYPSESMPYERYKKKFWKQMNKTHPLWFEEAKGNPGFSGGQVFDCVKTMLYGFDAELQKNPSLTPNMLHDPRFRETFVSSKFQYTGYVGTTGEPLEFTNDGTRKSPYLYFSITKKSMEDLYVYPKSDAFAIAATDTASIIFLKKPVFNGGSSTPPPDGPVLTELFIDSKSWMSFFVTGLAICNIILILYALQKIILRPVLIEPLISFSVLTSSILLTSSVFFSHGRMDIFKCQNTNYLHFSALSILYGALAFKSFRVDSFHSNYFETGRPMPISRLAASIIGPLFLSMLILKWMDLSVKEDIVRFEFSDSYFIYECAAQYSRGWFPLYAFLTLLVLLCYFFSRSPSRRHHSVNRFARFSLICMVGYIGISVLINGTILKRLITLLLKLALSFGASIMSTLYDKNDRTLAKSNIFAVEGGFYSETIAPIGKLKLQRRRLFDWTPKQAVFASFVERGSIHMIVLIELETHRVHYYPLQDIEEHSIRVQSTQQAKESAVTEVAGRDPNRRSVTLFLPRSTFMLWTQSAEQLSLLENGLRHTVRMAQRRSTREDKSRVTGATKEPTMSVVGTGHST